MAVTFSTISVLVATTSSIFMVWLHDRMLKLRVFYLFFWPHILAHTQTDSYSVLCVSNGSQISLPFLLVCGMERACRPLALRYFPQVLLFQASLPVGTFLKERPSKKLNVTKEIMSSSPCRQYCYLQPLSSSSQESIWQLLYWKPLNVGFYIQSALACFQLRVCARTEPHHN